MARIQNDAFWCIGANIKLETAILWIHKVNNLYTPGGLGVNQIPNGIHAGNDN